MPKQTFFNLPEEKRDKIYNAAINEFAEFTYDNSSINRIVKNAGISKGSLYQYFEDKKDIFKYILDRSIEQKVKYVSPVMMNPMEVDVFTLIREMYISAIRFAHENPRLVQIGIKLLRDKEHPIYKEIMAENVDASNDIFKNILVNAINRGEVREEIDLEFVSYIITSLNITVEQYFSEKSNYYNNNNFEEMMPFVDKLLDLLKNGISKK